MDKRIKELWTEALDTKRLPDGTLITQTKEVLRSETKGNRRPLCCLGVLCEIAVLEGVIPAPVKKPKFGFQWTFEDEYGTTRNHEDEDLPTPVMKWAGLDNHNPYVEYFGEAMLSVLNDDHELNFKEISELIKESL